MEDLKNDFYPLGVSELNQAVKIYSHAFYNDPLWVNLIPNDAKREKYLFKLFNVIVKYDFKYSEPYGTSKPLKGVSIWNLPGKRGFSIWGMLRSGIISLIFSPSIKIFIKARKLFIHVEEMHKKYCPEPHYYLSLLSVSPNFQSKGLASKLINPMIKKSNEQNIPIYLETMNSKNVPLYEHFGFKIMEEYHDVKTDIRVWALKIVVNLIQ